VPYSPDRVHVSSEYDRQVCFCAPIYRPGTRRDVTQHSIPDGSASTPCGSLICGADLDDLAIANGHRTLRIVGAQAYDGSGRHREPPWPAHGGDRAGTDDSCQGADVELQGANRNAWNVAAQKYVREFDEHLELARRGGALLAVELDLLGDVLTAGPRVVHLQSGHGLETIDLRRRGASSVIGVDFSQVTTTAAAGRAARVVDHTSFVVADVMRTPLADRCADLVYTGKGALMWLDDLDRWVGQVRRLLVDTGHLFVFEEHPVACLWSRDDTHTVVRGDRNYFGGTRVNDSFPASGIKQYTTDPTVVAVEWQWTIADVVNTILNHGFELMHLGEYPEPFWRPQGVDINAWNGRLPNAFSLLARRKPS
jgi:SAM-dependent methyltransferase